MKKTFIAMAAMLVADAAFATQPVASLAMPRRKLLVVPARSRL